MISIKTFHQLALSFPGAKEVPHFHKRSYRVHNRIFATLDEQEKTVVIKLQPVDQSAFCAFDASIIYPAPGLWGGHGWTIVNLNLVRKSTVKDALATAYNTVAKKK
ncbi:MAG: MmcQ/YjbR family DNA-binding protein [Bacteroidota bacterium]